MQSRLDFVKRGSRFTKEWKVVDWRESELLLSSMDSLALIEEGNAPEARRVLQKAVDTLGSNKGPFDTGLEVVYGDGNLILDDSGNRDTSATIVRKGDASKDGLPGVMKYGRNSRAETRAFPGPT